MCWDIARDQWAHLCLLKNRRSISAVDGLPKPEREQDGGFSESGRGWQLVNADPNCTGLACRFVLETLASFASAKVVKLQSPRWAAVAAQEWSHGPLLCVLQRPPSHGSPETARFQVCPRQHCGSPAGRELRNATHHYYNFGILITTIASTSMFLVCFSIID